MGRVKNWKPGDIGWIQTCDMNGIIYQKPQQVKVLSVESEGLHPIKVQTVKSGDVLYCTLAELQTRAAKAERNPARAVPEKVKKEAEKMTEKKIAEFMNRPTFAEVAESFYAIAEIGRTEESKARDVVISLAEKALYDKIKDGCVWEAKA